MASTEHDDNCLNCNDRREISTCPKCVECINTSENGTMFPNWQPIKEKD